MNPQRLEVTYRGHVQGVGFRYTCLQLSEGWNLTGYVQNLSNGDVRMVLEGDAAVLKDFQAAVRQRLSQNIDDETTVKQAFAGEFDAFTIRR